LDQPDRRRRDDERIEKILKYHESWGERLDEKLEPILKMLENHEKSLHGNGTPGLIIRTDRLEQAEETRKRHFLVIWGGIATVGVKAFWAKIFG
jgi:hypothetical protein